MLAHERAWFEISTPCRSLGLVDSPAHLGDSILAGQQFSKWDFLTQLLAFWVLSTLQSIWPARPLRSWCPMYVSAPVFHTKSSIDETWTTSTPCPRFALLFRSTFMRAQIFAAPLTGLSLSVLSRSSLLSEHISTGFPTRFKLFSLPTFHTTSSSGFATASTGGGKALPLRVLSRSVRSSVACKVRVPGPQTETGHECAHGSLFSHTWMNDIAGFPLMTVSIFLEQRFVISSSNLQFVFMPYYSWQTVHGVHHVSSGTGAWNTMAEVLTQKTTSSVERDEVYVPQTRLEYGSGANRELPSTEASVVEDTEWSEEGLC
jgi:hypothetical protein